MFLSRSLVMIFFISTTNVFSFDETEKDSPDNAALIKAAYESSTSASTREDFTRTIELCVSASKAKLTEPQAKYIHQLQSWALVKRAKSSTTDEDLTRIKIENAANPTQLSQSLEKVFAEALKDVTEAIKLNPANWQAFCHRAYCYSQSGQSAKAISDLDSAIRLNSKDGKLWFNRAELYFSDEKYEIAAGDYSEAIKLNQNDVQAITGRAHCYIQIGKMENAVADYTDVIKRAPKNAVAWLNRADAYLALKNYKVAGQDYREALIRDQSLSQAYRGVAWLYATSDDDRFRNKMVADKSVKRAIELDGKETVSNLVVLAASQAVAGDYSMARDTLKRVKKASITAKLDRERVKFIENQKWFLAGTGKK